MVSSKAKTVSIVFRAELTAVDEPAACHSPKREPRPGTATVKGRGLGNPPASASSELFFCYEGSARATPGAHRGSSRNVRIHKLGLFL
jgi:hypothetical protein